jgi:hypothetical protein
MATFHEMTGLDRYGENALAGDLAEEKVSQVCAARERPLQPFGPRRVPTERAQHTTWAEVIRHAPDFLEWGRFMEVQGSDGETVIFKAAKLQALTWWDGMMPVFFGIYLTRQDSVLFCDLPTVLWAIAHPEAQELILDPDTRNPKTAFQVPVWVLLERETTDAFAASKKQRKV